MPLSDDTVHYLLIGLSALILLVVVVLLVVVLRKSENYDVTVDNTSSGNEETHKGKSVVKRYNGVTNPNQIALKLQLHPDVQLRQQIDDNYGQLERLKVVIEEKLYDLTNKEYVIDEIKLLPSVQGKDFVVGNKTYPRITYALFHFYRPDNKTNAFLPVTGDPSFGAGIEELIYSQMKDAIEQPNSPIVSIL